MKNFMTVLGTIAFLISSLTVVAADFDLSHDLKDRNEYFLRTHDKTMFKYLYDKNVSYRMEKWLNHPDNQDYVVTCQASIRGLIRAPKVLGPFCYFLRQGTKAKRAQAKKLLAIYILGNKLTLKELAGDPRYDAKTQMKAAKYLAPYLGKENTAKALACLDQVIEKGINPNPLNL